LLADVAKLSLDRGAVGGAAGGDVDGCSAAEDAVKRIRTLQKKLRQIEALEAKRSEGEELNAEQTEKITTKAALEAELFSLQST
jgi:hypothetical protein